MKCLNCRTEMTNNQVTTIGARIAYDMCDACGSLWLDSGELDKIAFRVTGSIEYCEAGKDAEPEQTIKRCPRCVDFDLQKVRFLESDDIFLHYCRNCGGFWLDGGELNLVDTELARVMPVAGKGFSDFVNNVHVPYWSRRIRKPSSETDFQVEVPPIHSARLERSTSDVCPACQSSLNLYSIFRTAFEGCPACKGVWLIKDELRKLKNKEEDASLRWMNDEIENLDKAAVVASKRLCVTCKTAPMVSVIFGNSSTVIDWCQTCHGMWLDRGEFEDITGYLKHELTEMRSKDIGAKALEDVKRIASGGPESRFEDMLDAKAALSAMLNASIFENPKLFALLASHPH